MDFKIDIEQFSGPLDLMLFLIKDKKLDLFDLNIEELADQYIAFINAATDEKLEIASEYLSELAGLIEYKSKKLLPRDTSEFDADDVEDSENDLVKRLIEYQRYKDVSLELAQRFEERSHQHSKPVSSGLFKELRSALDESMSFDQTPYDLMNAMSKVLERFKLSNPLDMKFESKELSVEDVIGDIRRVFRDNVMMDLETLFAQSPSVQHAIVTFLAALDMIRMGELGLSMQDDVIYLKGKY